MCSVFLCCTSIPAQAQQTLEAEETVHWAYAAFMGTGLYKLDDNREVFILRVPLDWQWREPALTEDGQRRLGVRFEAPLSLGLHQLDGLNDLVDSDNFGTLSITPGVELDYLASERWKLRGYAHLGRGGATDGGEAAWIYDLGVRSRYAFRHGALDWGLVNELFHAGYDPDGGPADSLGGFLAGTDFSLPLAGSSSGLALSWDLSYRWLGNNLSFRNRNASTSTFDDEWQLGIALARPGRPFKLGFLSFPQLGLGYRFASEGGFSAITLNFQPLFDR